MKFAKIFERNGEQALVDIRYSRSDRLWDSDLQVYITYFNNDGPNGFIHPFTGIFKSLPYPQHDHVKRITEHFESYTPEWVWGEIDKARASVRLDTKNDQ